ncbi:MAG: hypothetical protein JWN52_5293 [Actinomycetia bacterium]|jgi:hypothetical protein|nr:hypothetical protein [Actinomycetes bacterium]
MFLFLTVPGATPSSLEAFPSRTIIIRSEQDDGRLECRGEAGNRSSQLCGRYRSGDFFFRTLRDFAGQLVGSRWLAAADRVKPTQ